MFRTRADEPWQQTVVLPASDSSQPAAAQAGVGRPLLPMESGPWALQAEPLSDPLVARTLAAVHRQPSREQKLDERFNRVLDFILARGAKALLAMRRPSEAAAAHVPACIHAAER